MHACLCERREKGGRTRSSRWGAGGGKQGGRERAQFQHYQQQGMPGKKEMAPVCLSVRDWLWERGVPPSPPEEGPSRPSKEKENKQASKQARNEWKPTAGSKFAGAFAFLQLFSPSLRDRQMTWVKFQTWASTESKTFHLLPPPLTHISIDHLTRPASSFTGRHKSSWGAMATTIEERAFQRNVPGRFSTWSAEGEGEADDEQQHSDIESVAEGEEEDAAPAAAGVSIDEGVEEAAYREPWAHNTGPKAVLADHKAHRRAAHARAQQAKVCRFGHGWMDGRARWLMGDHPPMITTQSMQAHREAVLRRIACGAEAAEEEEDGEEGEDGDFVQQYRQQRLRELQQQERRQVRRPSITDSDRVSKSVTRLLIPRRKPIHSWAPPPSRLRLPHARARTAPWKPPAATPRSCGCSPPHRPRAAPPSCTFTRPTRGPAG